MDNERLHRGFIAASVMPTGNPWLDDALAGGLNRENLMLVAAKTGVGKTFFGVQLALHASKSGRKVKYFALEAEQHEIERRQLYYAISRLVHQNYPNMKMPRYREWLHFPHSGEWDAIEKIAAAELEEQTRNLETRYCTGIYTPDMFQLDVAEIASEESPPELVILDHLHHFFLSGNEIDSLKTTIHQIKRLKDDLGIPVVVLAQLRKGDAGPKDKKTLPSLEDIRGTASLTDIATDVVIISPVPSTVEGVPADISYPMYFHLAKSRTASEARSYAGIVGFSFKDGSYSRGYIACETQAFEDPIIASKIEIPTWAKRAIAPKMQMFIGNKGNYVD